MKPERTLFGFHPVVSRLRAAPGTILEIFVDEARDDARMRELVASAEAAGVRVLRVGAKRLDGFMAATVAWWRGWRRLRRARAWMNCWRCWTILRCCWYWMA